MPNTLNIALHVRREQKNMESAFELEVAFEMGPGITILFGPSGAGKSTILQAVAGLFRPQKGHILYGEEAWFSSQTGVFVPPEKRGIAYLFQGLALFPHMTAQQNVMFGMPRNTTVQKQRKLAKELLERVAVGHLVSRKPKTFSGGEAQRVALARALASSPRVLLLDEPFSALDQSLRKQLSTLVTDLVSELNIPTLQVTHSQHEASTMGDRILKMEAGKIIEDGSADIVFATPPLS